MLSALRIPRSSLGIDTEETRQTQVPVSPTDVTSPVPSLSRSILSASDTSPNGWVALELPRVSSPAHSPSASSGKSESDECPAHVRFQDTCLIIPDASIKSPGLAARMLAVGSWTTSKRRVSDPDREHSPPNAILGVRLPGLSRKQKHAPCEPSMPCPPLPLRPCLVHRSSSQPTVEPIFSPASSEPVTAPRPRLSANQSAPHHESSSLPSVLVRAPTRSNSMPAPSACVTIPLRECCTDCISACSKLDGVVHWSPGARRKRREDREEREREARAGLRDPASSSAYGWEDMLALESEAEDRENHTSSSKPVYSRRTTSPPPSSLATRRCGAIAAQALKHPHALPCPLPRTCNEDDTDEESLFPLPVSPRGARSPTCRGSKSPAKLTPNGSTSSTTPPSNASDELATKCADTANPAKCAEAIAAKCAEKAKTEVVVPAVRRLLEQQAFEGHRLSPVPGSEAPTPRCGTPTTPSFLNDDPQPPVPPKEERGRSQISKFDMAQVDELPPQPQRPTMPPAVGSPDKRSGTGRRRSSSASSVGRTIGAIVRGVAAGVVGGPSM
ncbi:unnamed protein product [Rhizoctonia solani]|uniref:Uncharacterized protein n=1 Tax=Rhizoctonia solani TaxID=456999 RepID=A0A8H3ASV9_9AGAM|nr:unnamed protein product [Rhizoctonia solani]